MNQKHQHNSPKQDSCAICFSHFNLRQNLSFKICILQHTLCVACIKKLKPPFNCPFCRSEIFPQKITLNKTIITKLSAEPQILQYLDQLKFKRRRGKIILTDNLTLPQMQQHGEFLLKLLQKITNYIIPLIYALQIFSFVGEIVLEFSQDECLTKQIADDTLTLRKYIIIDLGATAMFNLLVALTFLVSRIQGTYFQDFKTYAIPIIPRLFFASKFIFDCFIWFHIIYILQFKCGWMIEDFEIAQLVLRCGIIIFLIVLMVQTRMTSI